MHFVYLLLSSCIILAANRHRPCNLCVFVCMRTVFSLKNIAIYWIDARKSDSPPASCWTHTHTHTLTEMHTSTQQQQQQQQQSCNPTPDECVCVCVCEKDRERMLTLHCVIISNGLINTKIFRERATERERRQRGKREIKWKQRESRDKPLWVVFACFCTCLCVFVYLPNVCASAKHLA